LLIALGSSIWHVDLKGYLRSGLELIAGYNDAMSRYQAKSSLPFELAGLFLLAIVFTACCGRCHLPPNQQAMILPVIALACLLLFKNGFVRADETHCQTFFAA